jgi:protein required for attachment to host cells
MFVERVIRESERRWPEYIALRSSARWFDPDQCPKPVLRRCCESAAAFAQESEVNKLAIPHNALVFVGDGQKALFLRNDGDEKFPNLKTERVFAEENPPTHEQGTDRPGRGAESAGTGRRSSVAQTDWHHLEEHRFVARVAAALEDVVRKRNVPGLVVVAPPRTLADLRHAFHADVKKRIIAEIDKDLTKHPVGEIETHLLKSAAP